MNFTYYENILLFCRYYFSKLLIKLLSFITYTYVYDLETKNNLTFKFLINYKLYKNYSKIGVYRFYKNKYYKYICYNTKLSDIVINDKYLTNKNYNNIKKIELINNGKIINLTDVKQQFYDVIDRYTKIIDIINFYFIINNKTIELTQKMYINIVEEEFDLDKLDYNYNVRQIQC